MVAKITGLREDEKLLSCAFCCDQDGSETFIREQRLAPRMNGKDGALISVEIQHWCGAAAGALRSYVCFAGRDRESAIAAWNRRRNPET